MSAVPGGGGERFFPPKNKNSGPGLVGGLQVGFSTYWKSDIFLSAKPRESNP